MLHKIIHIIRFVTGIVTAIVLCAIIFATCDNELKPWKVVWYYEETLFPDNQPNYESSRPFPRQESFDIEKYPAYYIDNVFFGIDSETPREIFEYERDRRVIHFDVELKMEAADKRGIEKIIIDDIRIVSKSKKDVSYLLNETFPLEIPVDTEDYYEELESGAGIRREHISTNNPSSQNNPYWMHISYESDKIIGFEKPEVFYVFVKAEVVRTSGSITKEVQFTMKPKKEWGLIRWGFTREFIRSFHFGGN